MFFALGRNCEHRRCSPVFRWKFSINHVCFFKNWVRVREGAFLFRANQIPREGGQTYTNIVVKILSSNNITIISEGKAKCRLRRNSIRSRRKVQKKPSWTAGAMHLLVSDHWPHALFPEPVFKYPFMTKTCQLPIRSLNILRLLYMYVYCMYCSWPRGGGSRAQQLDFPPSFCKMCTVVYFFSAET